jgi:lysine 2,3-aminomutase
VLDIPGGAGKVPIGPNYISAAAGGAEQGYEVRAINGSLHKYPPCS